MQWARHSTRAFASDAGYRVAVFGQAVAFVYVAFAPEIPYDKFKLMLRERYALGDSIPQQREWLGCFSNADEARAVCQQHHQAQP